jgi:hypothetical protein
MRWLYGGQEEDRIGAASSVVDGAAPGAPRHGSRCARGPRHVLTRSARESRHLASSVDQCVANAWHWARPIRRYMTCEPRPVPSACVQKLN